MIQQTGETHEETKKSEYVFLYDDGNTAGKAKITYFNYLRGEEGESVFHIDFEFGHIGASLQAEEFSDFCDFIAELKGELCRIGKQIEKNGR